MYTIDGLIPLREKDLDLVHQVIDANIATLDGLGLSEYVRIMDGTEAQKVFPDIKIKDIVTPEGESLGDINRVLYLPAGGATIDPYLLTMAYAKRASAMGVKIRTKIEVLDIIVEAGKITGVETNRGKIKCDTVICAAGPWTAKIGKMAGVDIPITPHRCSLLKVMPLEKKNYPTKFFYFDAAESLTGRGSLWLHEERSGGFSGGPDMDEYGTMASHIVDPDDYNQNYTFDDVISFADKMEKFIPGFGEFEVIDGWAKAFACVYDGNNIIDRLDNPEGLIICSGDCGEGISASAGVGLLTSELVVDGKISTIENAQYCAFNNQRFPTS